MTQKADDGGFKARAGCPRHKMIEELENLLKRQIDTARRGGYGELLQLAGKSEELVARITEAGLLEKPENEIIKERIDGLYRRLHLLLSSRQNEFAERLRTLRRGKRTLSVYRGSV